MPTNRRRFHHACCVLTTLALLGLSVACNAAPTPGPAVTTTAAESTATTFTTAESATVLPRKSYGESPPAARETATSRVQVADGEPRPFLLVGAKMPPGWRLSEPMLPAALAGALPAPAPALLGALGETAIRFATMTDGAGDARPTVLLYALPKDNLSLDALLIMLADQLDQQPEILVRDQRIDYTLAAGKGSVGLLQYEQRTSASDPPLYGQIAVAVDRSANAFMLLVAAGAEADWPVIDALYEEILPTLTSERKPIQFNHP